MAVRWMIKGMIACFAHNLRGAILYSRYLVEMLPTFRLALTLKDIAFHPTTMLGLQPPCDKVIIHHLSPEDVVLLFLWANALKGVRDGGREGWPGEVNVGCRDRRLAI